MIRGGPSLRSGGVAVLSILLLAGGCAYFNSLYNAERLFGEAEADRWSGRRAASLSKYNDAIDKAARSFRSDPEGRWADDALVLMGRAYLHRSEWQKARGALRHALKISQDENMRAQARVYLGAVEVTTGRPAVGVALLDSALTSVTDEQVRAEGYLWRARGNLRSGNTEQGWRDLDAVGGGDERLRMAAEATRLTWAVVTDDSVQAVLGADRLLGSVNGQGWADSLAVLANQARRTMGPSVATRLLQGVEAAPWSPGDRNELLLERARLAAVAGDTATAIADARTVSSGVGRVADEARVLEARWRLAGVSEVRELDRIRELLLPAVGSREAAALLEWIKKVGLMVEEGSSRNEALAFFAAAEMARDSLGAPLLAKDLFRVYADQAPGVAWEAKALLAAMTLSSDPEERSRLRDRLETLEGNVYVRAWKREEERELDYVVVERRLRSLLSSLETQINAEAEERDILVSQTARMLDSIRTQESIRRRLEEGDSALLDSLRADSIRMDSIRMDSIRRADSLVRDTAFFQDDSLPPDTSRVSPRPTLVPYRPGTLPPPGPDPLLGGGSG